jgi:hypothetical protein
LAHAYTDVPSEVQDEWFAFTFGNVRFFVLNSNCDAKGCPRQTFWLREELGSKSSISAKFRIVLVHFPPFTELWDPKEGYKGEPFIREHWVPLFEKFNVDLVVSGHTHAYERGVRNNVIYIVIGGSGLVNYLCGERGF